MFYSSSDIVITGQVHHTVTLGLVQWSMVMAADPQLVSLVISLLNLPRVTAQCHLVLSNPTTI